MNKKDQLAVENRFTMRFLRINGMGGKNAMILFSLLYSCFQDFPREEIAEIYNSYQGNKQEAGDTSNSMSINCS